MCGMEELELEVRGSLGNVVVRLYFHACCNITCCRLVLIILLT